MLRPGILVFLCSASALFSQQPSVAARPLAAAEPQPLAIFEAISRHMARLQPMLEQVRVRDWVNKGAPEAYIQQLSSTTRELQAIQQEMAVLAGHPDQMQDCMRALFRVQAIHVPLDSLMGGLRKYQNPALAELIQSVAAEDETQVGHFEQYILQLAQDKDQQYAIVDKEAQRCRATLSVQPPARPKVTHNR